MGYTQILVLHVDETFSFVMHIESLHSLLMLITLEDWHKLIQLLCSLRYLMAKGRDVNGAPTRFHGCWTGDPDLLPVEGIVRLQTNWPPACGFSQSMESSLGLALRGHSPKSACM